MLLQSLWEASQGCFTNERRIIQHTNYSSSLNIWAHFSAHHHKYPPPRLRHHITRLEMLCVTILVFSRHQRRQPTFYQLLDCDSVTFALLNFGRPVWTESRTSNGFNFLGDGCRSRAYRLWCKLHKMFVLMLGSLQEMRIRVSLVYFKSHWILYVAWSKYKTCGIWI